AWAPVLYRDLGLVKRPARLSTTLKFLSVKPISLGLSARSSVQSNDCRAFNIQFTLHSKDQAGLCPAAQTRASPPHQAKNRLCWDPGVWGYRDRRTLGCESARIPWTM